MYIDYYFSVMTGGSVFTGVVSYGTVVCRSSGCRGHTVLPSKHPFFHDLVRNAAGGAVTVSAGCKNRRCHKTGEEESSEFHHSFAP